MSEVQNEASVRVSRDGFVGIVEIDRPPFNFFDIMLIKEVADIFEKLDSDTTCRSIVLCARGKSFCAGADLGGKSNSLTKEFESNPARSDQTYDLYNEALRLFSTHKPVIAAVHGAAIGGGLGLALAADFRITCKEARFSTNFNRMGFHPGFGLSATLPRLIGLQKASLLLYSGRRIGGEEAAAIGLADLLVEQTEVFAHAVKLALEIAASAPLAVASTRKTLRLELVKAVQRAMSHESDEQRWQFKTEDFKEGIAAMHERRLPIFNGR